MPNWCANRLYFRAEPARITDIHALLEGNLQPYYSRAVQEGIQLFVAGCAGLLQSVKDVAALLIFSGSPPLAVPVTKDPLCLLRRREGLGRASILARLPVMQGFASPLRSPGPSLPVSRDFPVVRPLILHGLTLQLPPAVRVGLRLPLRPCIPVWSPG